MMGKEQETESGGRRHGGRYIYEELRRQILTLKLKPGVQLDEVSLAAQFGLSRSPVRDALARLVTEGLVTILPTEPPWSHRSRSRNSPTTSPRWT